VNEDPNTSTYSALMDPTRQAVIAAAIADLQIAAGAAADAIIKLAQLGNSDEYRAALAAFGAVHCGIRQLSARWRPEVS